MNFKIFKEGNFYPLSKDDYAETVIVERANRYAKKWILDNSTKLYGQAVIL